jgi:dipeptidase E
MAGKLFLSGGGDEKQTFEVDKVFLEGVNSILYIPIAWQNEDYVSCNDWFTNAIKQHKEVKIEMLTDLSKDNDLSKFDAIYIGGGNTFKLLKEIKDNNFDKKLIEFFKEGKSIYGGSAGAIIQGADINTSLLCKDKDVNKVNLQDTSGLNLIKDHDIQAHYESDQAEEHQSYIRKTNRKVIAIPEESALIFDGKEFKAIGLKPITVISKDSSKDYQINETINIE